MGGITQIFLAVFLTSVVIITSNSQFVPGQQQQPPPQHQQPPPQHQQPPPQHQQPPPQHQQPPPHQLPPPQQPPPPPRQLPPQQGGFQSNVVPTAAAHPVLAVSVEDRCLQCMCHASTGCIPTACHLIGPTQYYCGMYLISWAYWADAGKPNDNFNSPYAFEACLNDKACAEVTIRQYMAKHGKDCNGDNVINCGDIARIHKAGPLDCHSKWVDNTTYWGTFQTCQW